MRQSTEVVSILQSEIFERASTVLIGGVWVFHGLYSKILNGIPRHRQIVARILGEKWARQITVLIGVGELALGCWAWSGRERIICAILQSLAIAAMNTLEIRRSRDLLISPWGMVILNLAFLSLVWDWALS